MLVLWLSFIVFAAAYFVFEQQFFSVLAIWGTALAIFLLVKNKVPATKYILISVCFSLAVSLCYLAIARTVSVLLFQGLTTGIPTLLCSLAVFSVMEKRGGFYMIRSKANGRSGFALSLLIAILTGALLSFINYLLMNGST